MQIMMTSPLEILTSLAPFIAIGGIIFLIHKRKTRLAKFNFDWYRSEFPQLVSEGKVKCYKCGGSHLGTERMMNQTYMRSHICRQCGTTLYYSKESH
jgi:hypothetical protein